MKMGVGVDIAKLISLSYDNDIKFEYDEKKSLSNLKKHGVSFEEAKILWFVPNVIVEANSSVEPRFRIIGKIKDKFYSCFYTIRDRGVIRLISARRSRKSEEVDYHECFKA